MKIRMLGNSIRLRLSQQEVQLLLDKGEVMESVHFANAVLHYSLQKQAIEQIACDFQNNHIKVTIPEAIVKKWATTEQVGVETIIQNSNDTSLKILIEKDFKCLTARPGEDESDLFPNPEKAHS